MMAVARVHHMAAEYFLDDYPSTLFPLTTTSTLVRLSHAKLLEHIYERVLDDSHPTYTFQTQRRVHAAKSGFHLRRTVKLDPVAELFIYDVVFRNRATFRKPSRIGREAFGYRFRNGRPVSPTEEYGRFRRALVCASRRYAHHFTFDVATYFGSIYHHDLVNHCRTSGWDDEDSEHLGRFLRTITSGRSVDCLPQGLHPCKMLGSDFLRFIDESHLLQSPLCLRFLDDFHLFADDTKTLTRDFVTAQQLLGDRGLSVNASKTSDAAYGAASINAEVVGLRAKLIEIRRELFVVSGDVQEVEEKHVRALSSREVDYLLDLLKDPDVDENDAELVLVLLRDHGDQVLPRIVSFLHRFPGLAKSIYNFVRFTDDRSAIAPILMDFLKAAPQATEFQLFWLGKIAEEFLGEAPLFGELLLALYTHADSTTITKAKILEIPDVRFGLPEIRRGVLGTGQSDWEAWAAAVGVREEPRASRNHQLRYFGQGSPINKIIADCVRSHP